MSQPVHSPAGPVPRHTADAQVDHTGATAPDTRVPRGSDEYPTLEQFQAYVHDGQIRYVVPGQGRGGGAQITGWVAAHYTATTVGGQTVHDLGAPAR